MNKETKEWEELLESKTAKQFIVFALIRYPNIVNDFEEFIN